MISIIIYSLPLLAKKVHFFFVQTCYFLVLFSKRLFSKVLKGNLAFIRRKPITDNGQEKEQFYSTCIWQEETNHNTQK